MHRRTLKGADLVRYAMEAAEGMVRAASLDSVRGLVVCVTWRARLEMPVFIRTRE